MNYYKKLTGKRLYLSPMRIEDAETYVNWMSDPAVTDGLGSTCQVLSVESEQKWLSENAGSYQFAIVRLEDDKLLGNCGFQELNQRQQCAEVGIFLGDEENRGRGYGTEALRLLVDYGFDCLNLHSILLKVFAFNERAIACYRKVGFRVIGRRRECYYLRGTFHDQILMDLLKGDRQEPPIPTGKHEIK